MDGKNHLSRVFENLPSPCFVIDESVIEKNIKILETVINKTGCKILLALKAFAMFDLFPLLDKTLHGTCAGSVHEARLGREEFGGEVHVYAPAFSSAEIKEVITYADFLVFNSFSQWRRFKAMILSSGKNIRCGIRINPEHSEAPAPMYSPCGPCSRLGVRAEQFLGESIDGISGLHFHALCEQNADALERTLETVYKKFEPLLSQMSWINLGGGHHITRDGYDTDLLCRLIIDLKRRYDVAVYLEPGEAVVLNAGFLVATVLDIVENQMSIAILDASAAAHMPDVLEMPYRPEAVGAGRPGEKAHTYRLAGCSCLAGDVIGDYSFDAPLAVGSRVVFTDMAHYTMVKTSTFNGLNLPAIARYRPDSDTLKIVREFDYADFKTRLS